jgi:hypothetical protein
MTSIAPLPFTPVAIAIETIKIKKRSDDLQLGGIDLESGRRVTINLEFDDYAPCTVDPISDLVILLTLERVLP